MEGIVTAMCLSPADLDRCKSTSAFAFYGIACFKRRQGGGLFWVVVRNVIAIMVIMCGT